MVHINRKKLPVIVAGSILLILVVTSIALIFVTEKKETLVIFHAGSLRVVVAALTEKFEQQHPNIKIESESAGSAVSIRKITEQNKVADILMSADYKLIDTMMVNSNPKWANWSIVFAKNEIVIAYTNQSKYADEITVENWYKIVNRTDVITARANPADDPCGYRALLTVKLASMYYNDSNLWGNYMSHHTFSKAWSSGSTNIIAPLQLGEVDYAFLYKSEVLQHHLQYIELPDQINLGNQTFNDFYKQAQIYFDSTTGEVKDGPGDGITEKEGNAIWYGMTIPTNTRKYDLALSFVRFVLSEEGLNIIENVCYQPVINPPQTRDLSLLPVELATIVIENPKL